MVTQTKRPHDHVQFLDVVQFEEIRPLPSGVKVSYLYTVLDKFRHHYTGEPVYKVRIETPGAFGVGYEGASLVEEKYISHRNLEPILERRSK